jgi:hypothetical protein
MMNRVRIPLVIVLLLVACHDDAARSTSDAAADGAVDAPAALACVPGAACGSGGTCAFAGCTTPGVYTCAQPMSSGTCSRNDDSDGDGLLDEWEMAGFIDLNCNGVNDGDGVDVQLPDSHVDYPDVYLELDYMMQPGSGATCSTDATCQAAVPGEQCIFGVCTHTHQPSSTSLVAVQTAAQRGLPGDVTRPGFYLHIDLAHENSIAETPVVAFDTTNGACVGPNAADFFALKTANFYSGPDGPTSAFAVERRLVYHYAIFGHYATCPPDASGGNTYCNACATDRGLGNPRAGATGTAETPGNDLIVSLGGLYFGFTGSAARPRTDTSEGGTLMHELGHNLFLGHGVTQTGARTVSPDGPLYSPTYFSVMNYNYQTRGVLLAAAGGGGTPAASKIDYSDLGACADLDESSLDEASGAGCAASTTYVVAYFADAGGGQRFASAQTGTAIDWNGDGTIASAPDNLNRVVDADSNEIFRSLDDWAYDAATHHFTTLQFDSQCYLWTLSDGVAPATAMSANELAAPEIVARGLASSPPAKP